MHGHLPPHESFGRLEIASQTVLTCTRTVNGKPTPTLKQQLEARNYRFGNETFMTEGCPHDRLARRTGRSVL
ncbi:hypothetical protein GCM10009850_074000 [Nonomuraea monospora]|uniref:Transposase n=1 Tax=Nonomuraea monospora TaxID=568818 RepID=A0ABN3CRW5_9ACTN